MKKKLLIGIIVVFAAMFLWGQNPMSRIIGFDTNNSNYLEIIWNEDDTSNRVLNVLVSGANRSLTVEADSVINSDLSTDANWSTSGSVTVGSLIGPAAALDINTSVIQDANFWDTIASGNPSINIYGWNTAGGDRESFSLSMSDTNDEAVLDIPNSANNEGFTLNLQETNQRFRIRQNSDVISIYSDGTYAYLDYSDSGGWVIQSTSTARSAIILEEQDDQAGAETLTLAPPINLTETYTFQFPAASGTTQQYLKDNDGSGGMGWGNLYDIANGIKVLGTNVAIINLTDGTYTEIIKESNAEGGAYRDLRFGVSTGSRLVHFMDDIDVDTNTTGIGLTPNDVHVVMWKADMAEHSRFDYNSWNASDPFSFIVDGAITFNVNADISAGNIFNFQMNDDADELTDANAQQAHAYFGARVAQSATAAFDGIYVNTLEEVFGDGTTGDGNNLLRAASLGTTAFQIQLPNSSLTYVHTSTLFDAVALTDSVTICTVPANSIIWSISMELETQFAAPAPMSDLDITIGDGTDADGFVVKAMNLTSDTVGTNYATRGALWNTKQQGGFYYVASAETIVASATAVGDDLSDTTAGQVRFTVAYMCLDEGV